MNDRVVVSSSTREIESRLAEEYRQTRSFAFAQDDKKIVATATALPTMSVKPNPFL